MRPPIQWSVISDKQSEATAGLEHGASSRQKGLLKFGDHAVNFVQLFLGAAQLNGGGVVP